ncbi:hypothetical protein N4297_14520, partial [Staphylococcus aureus]|nr:hypothetical protein [Staphylococcus aureus]
DNGVGSTWLTSQVKPGDYLWLSDAQGEFTCADREGTRYLMLAAGCGVTPIIKAADNLYPLYGELETQPAGLKAEKGTALVDARLLALLG